MTIPIFTASYDPVARIIKVNQTNYDDTGGCQCYIGIGETGRDELIADIGVATPTIGANVKRFPMNWATGPGSWHIVSSSEIDYHCPLRGTNDSDLLGWPAAGVDDFLTIGVLDYATYDMMLSDHRSGLENKSSWMTAADAAWLEPTGPVLQKFATMANQYYVSGCMLVLLGLGDGVETYRVHTGVKVSLMLWDTDYDTTIDGNPLAVAVISEDTLRGLVDDTGVEVWFDFGWPVPVTPSTNYALMIEYEDAEDVSGGKWAVRVHACSGSTNNYKAVHDTGYFYHGGSILPEMMGFAITGSPMVFLPPHSDQAVHLVNIQDPTDRLELAPISNQFSIPRGIRRPQKRRIADARTLSGVDCSVAAYSKRVIDIEMSWFNRATLEDLYRFWEMDQMLMYFWPSSEKLSRLGDVFRVKWVDGPPDLFDSGKHQWTDRGQATARFIEV